MAKKTKRTSRKPLKSAQTPATAQMLYEMEEPLCQRMDTGFYKIDARFSSVESKFSSIDARFNDMDSQFADIKSELHRVALIVEEQNARNKFVMDGYAQIYELLTHK